MTTPSGQDGEINIDYANHNRFATDSQGEDGFERSLTGRHIQFIAIGGAIGTGLFLGSGKSIALTGPSIVLVYMLVGAMMFVLMRAIGEMLYQDPTQHSFINFIGRYLGAGWGRFAGWSYWLVLLIIGMTELTAVSQYFVTFFLGFGVNLAPWRWLIEVCTVALILLINLISVKAFGETEFWFAMIKISLIIGMIITGIVMVMTHFNYPAHVVQGVAIPAGQASVSNIFHDYQLAPNGWMSFILSFQMVFFAYETIELLGNTVSETKDPRHVLPKAVNQIINRILIFYVGALLAIMAIVPWKMFKPAADGSFASPFIMVFRFAGVNWASALVFFVVITAAMSSMNSLVFTAGRQLYAVARRSHEPKLKALVKVSRHGVPARAIMLSAAIILVSPALSLLPGLPALFTLFSSTSSAVIIVIYVLVMIAHMRYRQSEDFLEDGFLLRGYQVWDRVAIVFFLFVYVTLFFSSETLLPALLGLVWFAGFGTFSLLAERRKG